MKKISLSAIRRVVNQAIEHDPTGSYKSMVDLIVKEHFALIAVECHEKFSYESAAPQIRMPPEILERYDALFEQWKESGNFPWRLEKITLEKQDYYLGYVSDTGTSTREQPFPERIIWLYPVEAIDTNV